MEKTVEHLEAEVTGLLGLLEELASNLPPGPFSPEPDLLGGGEWLRRQRDTCWACHLGPLAAGGARTHRGCYAAVPGTELVVAHHPIGVLGPGILSELRPSPAPVLTPVFWYCCPKRLGSWREDIGGHSILSCSLRAHPLLQITSDHQGAVEPGS